MYTLYIKNAASEEDFTYIAELTFYIVSQNRQNNYDKNNT